MSAHTAPACRDAEGARAARNRSVRSRQSASRTRMDSLGCPDHPRPQSARPRADRHLSELCRTPGTGGTADRMLCRNRRHEPGRSLDRLRFRRLCRLGQNRPGGYLQKAFRAAPGRRYCGDAAMLIACLTRRFRPACRRAPVLCLRYSVQNRGHRGVRAAGWQGRPSRD